MFNDILDQMHGAFIEGDRWQMWLNGLGVTLFVAFFAVLLGIAIGFIVAIVRASADMLLPVRKKSGQKGPGYYILSFFSGVCKAYLAVIRGTPVMVQLLIIFFLLLPELDKVPVAILGFGINSGAYVAEIVRSGIMSIDKGQMEAGRSLGFSYVQSMRLFVIPQAFKNVLPALANEFIVLLKETSIAGYIGLVELTRAANIIVSKTYEQWVPYIALAVIYFVVVMIFTGLVSLLERRLRNSEK